MQQASIAELKNALEQEGNDPSVDFINVCTPAEYAVGHIKGVRSVPLDTLEMHLAEFVDKKKIYIHCRSGARGQLAAATLAKLGVTAGICNVSGGQLAWQGAGLPLER